MDQRGRLIVIEGPDGVGKTTLAQALADELRGHGASCLYYAFPGRADGTLGQLVYRLHHRPAEFGITDISPASLQIMHVAAHADAIDRVILPALDTGTDVVLDRFWWSTWVYGMAGGLDERMLDALLAVEGAHWRGRVPFAGFLISSAVPFRQEADPETWETLCHLYNRILQGQAGAHPVYRVANEGTVTAAVGAITGLLATTRQGS